MEILDTKVLSGPNYWSNTRNNLIVMKLDLLQYEELPTNRLKGFADNLKLLLPTLYNHFCSEGKPGGFFHRVDDGTWLGHVIEHVALELQWLSGMKCGYGRTRSAHKKGVYYVVLAYELEEAGIYAAHAAVNLVTHLAEQKTYAFLPRDLAKLKKIRTAKGLGPSTQAIVEEAKKRNIPFTRMDDGSHVRLGQGCYQKQICGTVTAHTSSIAVDLASDKNKTKQILSDALIPTPRGCIVETNEALEDAIVGIKFPWVIKPLNGNHGRGITTNIMTGEKAITAFNLAKQISDKVIIEEFIKGHDYRFLIVNYKLVAVAKRIPARVVGDGVSTIRQLIDIINQEPNRGIDHENFLTAIKIDEVTLSILSEQNLTLESILPLNQILNLKHAANLSLGGTAVDVTDNVHPSTLFLAERAARLMQLDICGIDILAQNIALPLQEQNGAVLEVNASPGFRMHLSPESGKSRNVAKPVIDMLFAKDNPARIPIVAVTGTNGKTTTVRLVAHLAKEAGLNVGFTSTEGIYINHQKIADGDCSGPASAQIVLGDPLVNFAVLECARGGIIRSGLGFDACNISVITNITEDHLGQNDVHTLDELARVKEVVARSTMKNGYSILNADDDLVYKMKEVLSCKIGLFSTGNNIQRITQHCRQGGLAAYIDDGDIIIRKGNHQTSLGDIAAIPLTFSGQATCMLQNILSAILVAIISGFKLADITASLKNFLPTSENLPGRMNLFDINKVKVLVDYGHNEGAFIHLKQYMSQIAATKKIGIIAATGDRKNSDIQKVGFYAAQIFDQIIIRHDMDHRGRSNEEQTQLLLEGIDKANTIKSHQVKIISEEKEAIEYAISHATPGAFILYFPENILNATDYLKQREQQSMKSTKSSV